MFVSVIEAGENYHALPVGAFILLAAWVDMARSAWSIKLFCPSRVCGCLVWQMPPPKKISDRQRVLAQWRGVDLAPIEAAKAVRARRAGDVLPRLMKDLRMEARQSEAEIVKVWNSLLDPNITAHAQPANLHKGTLFVNVDNSVWLSEIVRYRRKEILDRLQHGYGKNLIQRISFRIG
jgi:hypothetical protein